MPARKTTPRETDKPQRGRRKSNPLSPAEQNRERKRRYREKQREEGKVAVELYISAQHRDAILASGESLQDAADEAFRLLMAKRARRAR